MEELNEQKEPLQPETLAQLALLTDALQVAGMVETLQQAWGMQEPLEVVTQLVREALDRQERDASLLVLLEELEARGVSDPERVSA